MRCEEVRDQLPELLLGSLDDVATAAVRRHLRGCAGCREEQDRLEDGIDALSRAAHDETPPDVLRARVMDVLADEWREAGVASEPQPVAASSASRPRRARGRAFGAAAVAAVLLMGSLAWGLTEHHRADLAAGDATSYRTILATLGGRDFRLGSLSAHGGWEGLQGQVVLYDGDTQHGWTSWGLVFAQDAGRSGDVTATLLSPAGDTLVLPPLHFHGGEASAWIVTHDDLTAFDRLTLTDADGHVLAAAQIHDA